MPLLGASLVIGRNISFQPFTQLTRQSWWFEAIHLTPLPPETLPRTQPTSLCLVSQGSRRCI